MSPRTARPTTLAVTEESTTIPNDSVAHCPKMSSIAKNTPANGALKVAAMPPAAPQATMSRMRRSSNPTTWASEEPKADPICTIGPSRPTEPPPPMHSALASDFTSATCGRMRPPLRATASMTSGTPCPRASGANRCTNGP